MVWAAEQLDEQFYRYPPVGRDDWRYGFSTGKVRALETQMLPRAVLSDMANAAGFEQAADLLGGSQYSAIQGAKSDAEIEEVLLTERRAVRELFSDLMLDESITRIFRARDDFANMRLAVRRFLTGRPLGADYSHEGNVQPEVFEEVFGQENFGLFPEYLQDAVERAVLAYYEKKDIRRIDYAIDSAQAQYNLNRAYKLNNIFLQGLFRIQIDLANIRTMLRLKWNEYEERTVFIPGGFIEPGRPLDGLDAGYEALAAMFFATPYYEILEAGVSYLTSNNSFLRVEQFCENHLMGFLKTTRPITAGPQPVIAYLLARENEIRKVRLIVAAKRHGLRANLILDRVSEGMD